MRSPGTASRVRRSEAPWRGAATPRQDLTRTGARTSCREPEGRLAERRRKSSWVARWRSPLPAQRLPALVPRHASAAVLLRTGLPRSSRCLARVEGAPGLPPLGEGAKYPRGREHPPAREAGSATSTVRGAAGPGRFELPRGASQAPRRRALLRPARLLRRVPADRSLAAPALLFGGLPPGLALRAVEGGPLAASPPHPQARLARAARTA